MRLLSSFSPPPSSVIIPHMNSKTNSTVIFARTIVIVITVMFFICGLLHLLVRYLIKRKRLLSSSRIQESGVHDGAFERQLQDLFNLHDSGLDQDFIESLPVFSYKELMGLKEPFDCAVCLCEFTQMDNLRLLPLCSHAFHMHCIDTWLISNSTCPLCRGTIFTPGFCGETPLFEFDGSREENGDDDDDDGQGHFGHFDQHEGSIGNEKRVNFRATDVGKREREVGETSNSNIGDDGQAHFGHFNRFEGCIGNENRVYYQGHSGHFKHHEGSIGNEKRGYGQGYSGHFNQHEGSVGNEKRVYGQGNSVHFNQHERSIGNETRVYVRGHSGHFNQFERITGNEKRVYGQGHSGHFNQFEGIIGNEKWVPDQGHSSHFNQVEGRIDKEKRVYGDRHSGHFNQFEDNIGNEKMVYGQGHSGHFNHFEGSIGNEKRVYGQGHSGHFNQHEGSVGIEKRVYPVKLGKFRTINVGKRDEKEAGETSKSNLDARRCYSMGTYEYVVGNSELKVEYVPSNSRRGSFGNKNKVVVSIDGVNNGNKISNASKGESFSVSKIWLWSKKDHNHQKSQIF